MIGTLLIIFSVVGLLAAGLVTLCCLASDNGYEEYYCQDYECPQCKGWAIAFYQGKDKKSGGIIIRVECLDCGHYEDRVITKDKRKKNGPNQM